LPPLKVKDFELKKKNCYPQKKSLDMLVSFDIPASKLLPLKRAPSSFRSSDSEYWRHNQLFHLLLSINASLTEIDVKLVGVVAAKESFVFEFESACNSSNTS
jgi:hypothetical protein